MGMSRLPLRIAFHLADGFGDADLAGHASMQLKMVRQRQNS
jgi:hypothetical protein